MSWWYVSFARGGWLGAAYVEADDPLGACRAALRRGCNPGGEALLIEVPEEEIREVPERDRWRLLSRADLEGLWGVDDLMTVGG